MSKIVFYLMNEKGFYVLDDFMKKFSSALVTYVVLAKDKNVEKDFYDELRDLCSDNSIKFYDRREEIPLFSGVKLAIGWRWIIKDADNLIVLHDSILPKYRGFAPLVNMLINGERELGVTALFASREYDRGPIIKIEKIAVEYPIKIKAAIKKILPLYAKLVCQIVKSTIQNEMIVGVSQNEEEATYSIWRDEKDYFINWDDCSSRIRKMVDALGPPYAGARTYVNGEIVIIDEVEEHSELNIENRDVGKVILITEQSPIVICGIGLLKIKSARCLKGQSIIPLEKFRSRFGG